MVKIPFISKLFFYRNYSTKGLSKWWDNREMDWEKDYFATWKYPHRAVLTMMLKPLMPASVWEVGVGGGANLMRIIQEIYGGRPVAAVLGGSDISKSAIDFCTKKFQGGVFHHESGDDMMMSDKSVDIIVTDMTLIYVGPFKIKDYLKEFKRVARKYVILLEFNSPSFKKRWLYRIRHGQHAHDYRKLLEDLGYYNIIVQRVPPQFGVQGDLIHVITAQIP